MAFKRGKLLSCCVNRWKFLSCRTVNNLSATEVEIFPIQHRNDFCTSFTLRAAPNVSAVKMQHFYLVKHRAVIKWNYLQFECCKRCAATQKFFDIFMLSCCSVQQWEFVLINRIKCVLVVHRWELKLKTAWEQITIKEFQRVTLKTFQTTNISQNHLSYPYPSILFVHISFHHLVQCLYSVHCSFRFPTGVVRV